MARRRLADHAFAAPRPVLDGDVWWFTVDGVRHGPHPTEAAAESQRHHLFRRWRARAQDLDGWAWRQTAVTWVVTVPVGVPVRGAPLEHRPCARPEGHS